MSDNDIPEHRWTAAAWPRTVIWASIGTLALKSGRARNRGLKWMVGAQALATVGLIASIY